jgi:glycosyltransferase involved in cell wall biosynthesis
MFKNKTVSVVVPAHNEEKLIHIVLQTFPDWVDKVIVVDDCSTDATAEVVRRHIKEDSRVSLVMHTENKGVGGGDCLRLQGQPGNAMRQCRGHGGRCADGPE